jgi:hypothetical protein
MNKVIMYSGIVLMTIGFLAIFYGIAQLNRMPTNDFTATYNTTNTSWMLSPTNPQGLSLLGSIPAFAGTLIAIQGVYMDAPKKSKPSVTTSNVSVTKEAKE